MPELIALYTQNSVVGTFEKVGDQKWVITVRFHSVVVLIEEYNSEETATTNWIKLLIDPKFFVPPKSH